MKYIPLIVTLLFSVWVNPAAAQSADVVEVKVKGLVCSFCVQGVEKLLKDLPGVQNLEIKLSKQTVYLTVASKNEPTDESIRKAVKAAGYDVEAILRAATPEPQTKSPPAVVTPTENGT